MASAASHPAHSHPAANTHRPAQHLADRFEPTRNNSAPQVIRSEPQESKASRRQRRQQVTQTIKREIEHLPLPAEERKRLEHRALEPGKSAEDKRVARNLRRVVYMSRKLPPSAQKNLVDPFVSRPDGARARSAAALTKDRQFKAASPSERELVARVFPETTPGTVRGLPAAARQLSGTQLSKGQRENVLVNTFSEYSEPATRSALKDVLHSLKGQPAEAQTALLKTFATEEPIDEQAQGAKSLVHSPAWTGLGSTQRTQLAHVFHGAAGSDTLEGLDSLRLLSQQPQRLMDTDAKGGTLLSNLANLAHGPLHPGIGESRRSELLDGVLQETANAGQVDQTIFNTCTVTSMQYELARDNPAEFARLVAGIAGPTGRVDMRGGGELELQQDALPQEALNGRSFSEALFQTSLMEFANGTDDYHVQGAGGQDESVMPDGTTYRGQDGLAMVRATSALFGRNYADWSTSYPSDFGAQMDFLRNYRPDGPNAPVLLSYDTNGSAPDGGHAVTFMRVEGDRVFFRNPWGPTDLPVGATEQDGSRVEDPATGLYSFSMEELRGRISGLTVPAEFRPPLPY